MGALFAIYKREVALYFKSFIAYGITFAVMLFLGVFLQIFLAFSFSAIQQGGQAPPAIDIAMNGLFYLIILIFVISPVLSMRLLSEEAREGTLEVLMTLPISEWVFVTGKFLAAWTFFTFILALTLLHVALLSILGPINTGIFFVAYLGTWLYGGATIALCMIWSAITEDQLVAAFLGVTSIAGLMLASFAGQVLEGNLLASNTASVLRELGLMTHFFDTMLEGLLRAQDIAYFVLMIVISLFITTLIVGTRRWRAS